ncbi:hypothetical protein [Methanotorris igneus]|uniref:Uncharacterized protein n=1 Tax=Methanotorris igneus (strain DSM 5666 / JCM 11834 / Kol 5) TaxID=880724 RepID=F6BBQ4_METIK|nr:hypothetical protein [Methanotorris igneus]AEF96063.1 hypothetical protein Metig_0507 [Methanotorris igneus Kol 5]
MGFLSIFKRDRQENIQNLQQTEIREINDYETKYNELLEEINMLKNDLLAMFRKDAYYLSLSKIAYTGGVEEAEIWIDYHSGRISALTAPLTRLFRIIGEDPSILEQILLEEKNKAINDILSCEKIQEALEEDIKQLREAKDFKEKLEQFKKLIEEGKIR